MPSKSNVAVALRTFLNGNGLNMTNPAIDAATGSDLKEADMTTAAFPCLVPLAANAQALAHQLVGDLQAIGVGLVLAHATNRVQLAPGGLNIPGLMPPILMEALNSFLEFGGTPGFQAWKTLVDLLRLIKMLER